MATHAFVIGQAAVVDLYDAAADRLGDGASQDFMGGEPDEQPDRYAAANPVLDAGRMHLVHGADDDTVPPHYSSGAVDSDGRQVPNTIIDDTDHMDVIDPTTEAWRIQVELIEGMAT